MSDLFGGALPITPAKSAAPAPTTAVETPPAFGSHAWVWCGCGRPNSIYFAASGLRRCMRCAIAEGRGYRTEHAG